MNYRSFQLRLIILLSIVWVSQLHAQQTGYEKFTKPQLSPIADINIPGGSDPYAIHLTGVGLNQENTFFSVASNNPQLIKAIDIQPSSNGKAFIQYALNKGETGTSLIIVKVYSGDEQKASVRRFSIHVYSKDKQQEAIEDPQHTIQLETFPNPSANITTLKFSTINATVYTEVAIYNTAGNKLKVFYSGNTDAGKPYFLRIAGEQYTKGVYFIRVVSGRDSKVQKFIIR